MRKWVLAFNMQTCFNRGDRSLGRPAISDLIISAKDLGAFALEWACKRCLWVGLHVKPLPYQSFPGIFSSIDAFNKRVVHSYFDREGMLPEWLFTLGNVVRYVEPPSYHRFSVNDPATEVTLRGVADGIFLMKDGSYTIVDYKTAKYTKGQHALLPIYRAQLNGYAYIANRLEFSPISQLALIYMEPVTDVGTASSLETVDGKGFSMGLSATVVPVELNPEGMIPTLIAYARRIFDLLYPPQAASGCKNCKAVESLFSSLQQTTKL